MKVVNTVGPLPSVDRPRHAILIAASDRSHASLCPTHGMAKRFGKQLVMEVAIDEGQGEIVSTDNAS